MQNAVTIVFTKFQNLRYGTSAQENGFFNKECMMNNEFYNASPCKKTIVYSALDNSI